MIIIYFLIVSDNIDIHTVTSNTTNEFDCIIETINSFQTLPNIKDINIEKLTKHNDTSHTDKNISIELQNESISNVVLDYNLWIDTNKPLSLEIPVVQLNKSTGKNFNICIMSFIL